MEKRSEDDRDGLVTLSGNQQQQSSPGTRKGRKKSTWRMDLQTDTKKTRYTWRQIEIKVQERRLWKTYAPGGTMSISKVSNRVRVVILVRSA